MKLTIRKVTASEQREWCRLVAQSASGPNVRKTANSSNNKGLRGINSQPNKMRGKK